MKFFTYPSKFYLFTSLSKVIKLLFLSKRYAKIEKQWETTL
jgi:hypothetical protein